MKQILLVVILATASSTFARLGDTQKEFEQANPDFKYTGESPGNAPNTMVRQYQRDGTVAQVVFGADGKIIMEAYSDLSGKVLESSLVPVAKSYGYDFSALQKISVSTPWKALVLHRDFWFSADHKFCVGIGDVVMNDSETASTMTVAGEQVAQELYQNSTEKGSDEPAKMPTPIALGINAALILLWLVCVVVCFLKWKTWTAIFGIIGLIVANLPTTGTHLHYLILGPATSLALLVVAIRLAKPVSWWAKWFYWGPMGSDRRLLNPTPKLARALARFPEQSTDFEQPEAMSK
jgi:hypothetical protein